MDAILTREQVREVDRLAIEELGIPGVVLMENAGRTVAEQVRYRIRAQQAERVAIFCGPGNNGGDGFVIARHLANHEIISSIFLAGDPGRLSHDCHINYDIVAKMGLTIGTIEDQASAQEAVSQLDDGYIVVDALLGTGFNGDVRQPMADLILGINQAKKSLVFAVDVPSGLDCNTGVAANATIEADLTMTFVASKVGLIRPDAQRFVGELLVGGIGAPPSLIKRVQA